MYRFDLEATLDNPGNHQIHQTRRMSSNVAPFPASLLLLRIFFLDLNGQSQKVLLSRRSRRCFQPQQRCAIVFLPGLALIFSLFT